MRAAAEVRGRHRRRARRRRPRAWRPTERRARSTSAGDQGRPERALLVARELAAPRRARPSRPCARSSSSSRVAARASCTSKRGLAPRRARAAARTCRAESGAPPAAGRRIRRARSSAGQRQPGRHSPPSATSAWPVMYAASSESRKQASCPGLLGRADAPQRDEPRHLFEEALAAAEVLPRRRVEGRVDPAGAERVDADALAAVVARDLTRERQRRRLRDGVRRELRLGEQRGVGGRDADRAAARGAQMRHRGAAHDRMRAHVDRERAIEILRARLLDGAPDLHAHVRPDVVETTERLRRRHRRMPAKRRDPPRRHGTPTRRARRRAHRLRARRYRPSASRRRARPAAARRRFRSQSHSQEPASASPYAGILTQLRKKCSTRARTAPIQPDVSETSHHPSRTRRGRCGRDRRPPLGPPRHRRGRERERRAATSCASIARLKSPTRRTSAGSTATPPGRRSRS